MIEATICAILEKHLLLVVPVAHTVFENKAYTPETGVIYQRVHHLFNDPVDHAITADVVERRGVLWVNVFAPLDKGRVPAQTVASSIAAQFKPVQQLSQAGVTVEITKTAKVGSGERDGDRWMVPVSVEWRAFSG